MSRFIDVEVSAPQTHLPTDELVMLEKNGVWIVVWEVKHKDNMFIVDDTQDPFTGVISTVYKLRLYLEDITVERMQEAINRWLYNKARGRR